MTKQLFHGCEGDIMRLIGGSNLREHFEAWHKEKCGYVANYDGTYETTACQGRWEAWQACANWHTQMEMSK